MVSQAECEGQNQDLALKLRTQASRAHSGAPRTHLLTGCLHPAWRRVFLFFTHKIQESHAPRSLLEGRLPSWSWE